MTIFIGSRYQTATVAAVADANQTLRQTAFRGPSPLPTVANGMLYVAVAGDRLDRLAYQFYGRPDFWWVIADANSVIITDPITPGTVLVIPDGLNIR